MPKPRRPADLSRDHARPRTVPAPSAAAVEARLAELVTPALFAAGEEYRRLGLRARVLTLPVMVGVVLALVWRQVASVAELVRLIEREGFFLVPRREFSPQALSLRLRVLPAALFGRVFADLLPTLRTRAAARTRPLPPALAAVRARFPVVWAADGSTLEAVFKRVGLLRGVTDPALGGAICAIVDVATRLPVELWFDPEAAGNDGRFRDRIAAALPDGALLLVDRGFYAFPFFDWFTDHGRWFVTRAREVAAFDAVATLAATPRVHDRVVAFGKYRSNPCAHPLRLVEVTVGARRYRYLTNVLDPAALTAAQVHALYGERWRVEEAFALVKRLLGLGYLWSGSANAVALQVWATWLLYAVLVDLTDAVADELGLPLAALSLEMTFRGLYHFSVAAAHGTATDPVAYLADPANRDLGVVKRTRPKRARDRLANLPPELNL